MISARPVTPEDERLFSQYLENDPLHQSLGIKFSDLADGGSYLISDLAGPLIFVRMQQALRFAMQFDADAPFRTGRHAGEIVEWLKIEARKRNCTELICRPGADAVKFAERLGFEDFSGGRYLRLSGK